MTWYAGLARRVLASVDFPEPLGHERVERARRDGQAHAPQDLAILDGDVQIDDLEGGWRRSRGDW